jgi:hypothetical protein
MATRHTNASDVEAIRDFIERELDNRRASGLPKSDPYVKDALLAQDAIERLRTRLEKGK